jgi:hypothetical protein
MWLSLYPVCGHEKGPRLEAAATAMSSPKGYACWYATSEIPT